MATLPRIMYVEDEADIRQVAEFALEDDFELLFCASGEEALEKALAFQPELILLDVMMPGMDGPTTLAHLRKLPALNETPAVFLTAKVQPNEVEGYKKLGAIEVIAKPFDATKLSEKLKKILQLSTPKANQEQSKLEALQQTYTLELPAKLAGIEQSWKAVQHNHQDLNASQTLNQQIHNLAGSAGTFGFSRLSIWAKKIEISLKKFSLHNQPGNEEYHAINEHLKELKTLVEQGPDNQQNLETKIPSKAAMVKHDHEKKLVYVIAGELFLAKELASQLKYFGYNILALDDLNQAINTVNEKFPAAVILDFQEHEHLLTSTDLPPQLIELSTKNIPIIFVSDMDNWQTRLTVARIGGDAYLTKPVDFNEMLDHLDLLTSWRETDSYRVLVVDDMEVLAEHYTAVLSSAGMQVDLINQPSELLERIKTFKPELILMDIYMPNCSGLEAAKVIRQKEELLSIPIVFLSTEIDSTKQLAALKLGGDDFLQKPITNGHLIAAVSTRIERFRKLRSYMHHDSLTGLLNHVTIKLQLEAELQRKARKQSELVFGMLDIDLFKEVNDQYGHPAGDLVIKNLSRLLLERLRKSDIVGRYGGEEFAVILPDTPLASAVALLDDLREQFSQVTYRHQGQEFSCSFSAGLATASEASDGNALIRAADAALYEAKEAGRNCIRSSELE